LITLNGKNSSASLFNLPTMSDDEFESFSKIVYSESRINLSIKKKSMLTSRLRKRLMDLKISTFREYYEYLNNSMDRNKEIELMLNEVSTNKTEFFREASHFEYLIEHTLPLLMKSNNYNSEEKLKVWSAGCSTGEEVYTLAFVLNEYFSNTDFNENFSILATDISSRVLEIARRAIYTDEAIMPVPHHIVYKYFMRGKGSQAGFNRIVPELRRCITFQRDNITDINSGFKTKMDVIFCRNVIIYFDKQTQVKLFQRFYNQLKDGGYIFIGNSETQHGINDQFSSVAPTVYRKIS